MKAAEKSRFGKLVAYLLDPQGKKTRVGEVSITNCISTDTTWAVREITATQRLNARAISDRTYHLLVWAIPLSEGHLRSLLTMWSTYYNRERPHMALGPGVPDPPRGVPAPLRPHRHPLSANRAVVARDGEKIR